jgi:hypothetical protein
MVTEVNGCIVAAVSIAHCSVIADPFCPSVELVELLRLSAKELLHAPDSRRSFEMTASATHGANGAPDTAPQVTATRTNATAPAGKTLA